VFRLDKARLKVLLAHVAVAALSLAGCARQSSPVPAVPPVSTKPHALDIGDCIARSEFWRGSCPGGQAVCATDATWGGNGLQLLACFENHEGAWHATANKSIKWRGAEELFVAQPAASGVGCYFYGTSTWDQLGPEAREHARRWAGCTEILANDPF
jgi:hypothetical protein